MAAPRQRGREGSRARHCVWLPKPKKPSRLGLASTGPRCGIPPHPQPLSRVGERGADFFAELQFLQPPSSTLGEESRIQLATARSMHTGVVIMIRMFNRVSSLCSAIPTRRLAQVGIRQLRTWLGEQLRSGIRCKRYKLRRHPRPIRAIWQILRGVSQRGVLQTTP